VARALESIDPWGFGVATVREGDELRRGGIERRILVFTPLLTHDFIDARALNLVPTLGGPEAISAWIASGGGAWHLSVDTGMNRAGVPHDRIASVAGLVREHPPEGAFTHFHSADRSDGSMERQQRRFEAAIAALPARPRLLHAENSPGLERQSPSPWDLARPGVFLYGVGGGPGSAVRPEPVAHLRARIVELREVADGETVSYGATWRASGTARIATVAAGYADGVRRALEARGQALVHGKRVPIAGVVTMDMTMLDVTGVRCEIGDVATFLGRDGHDLLDVNEVARQADLSPYELLVGLRLRAPRVYAE
jgi:alanine racemase